MKIVIVGCGNVGSSIARSLSREGHNITIIDTKESRVRDLTNELDIMGVEGNGVSLESLRGVEADKADLLIAVTDSDEKNMLTCLLAKKIGKCSTIARVRNPEYYDEIELLKDDMGLNLSVNPEYNAAKEIEKLLRLPTATEIDTFAKGRVDLLKFEVKKDSPICGMALCNMHKELNTDVLVCVVERGNETMIPTGDFTLWEGDKVSFVASVKKATQFFKAINMNQGRVKSCIIVGGGPVTEYLTGMLISDGVDTKIINEDKKVCEELAEKFPQAVIINGDATGKELLTEEGIERTEAFVCLSDLDEKNIMMAIYAKSVNPKAKLVTMVHRSAYDDIISNMEIGSIVNPKLLAAEDVVKYVRALSKSYQSDMESLYQLNAGKAEAIEFKVTENSELVNVKLMDLKDKLKPNVLIACIIHQGQIITPNGQSKLMIGDNVIVVTTETGFNGIMDILK